MDQWTRIEFDAGQGCPVCGQRIRSIERRMHAWTTVEPCGHVVAVLYAPEEPGGVYIKPMPDHTERAANEAAETKGRK